MPRRLRSRPLIAARLAPSVAGESAVPGRQDLPDRSKMTHRRRAASKFNYIILKLLTLPYTYFLGTQTVSLCQDQLYVSRPHDVVRACAEDGGSDAGCSPSDHRRLK